MSGPASSSPPGVTIIVHSPPDAPSLLTTLESVAAIPNLGEEVVVLADPTLLPPLEALPLPVRRVAETTDPLPRQLNAILEATRGAFIHLLRGGDAPGPTFYGDLLPRFEADPTLAILYGAPPLAPDAQRPAPFTRDHFTETFGYRVTTLVTQPASTSTGLLRRARCESLGALPLPESASWEHELCVHLSSSQTILRSNTAPIHLGSLTPSPPHPTGEQTLSFLKTNPLSFYVPPSLHHPPERFNSCVLQMARLLLDRARLAGCRHLLDKLRATSSKDPALLRALPPLYAAAGDVPAAIESAKAWLAVEPHNRDATALLLDLSPAPYGGPHPDHHHSILFVTHCFPPAPYAFGGTELYTHNLARALLKEGFHAAVLHPLYESFPLNYGDIRPTRYRGVDVHQVHLPHYVSLLKTLWDPHAGDSLADYVRDQGFEVVHFQYPLGFALHLAWALRDDPEIKTVFTLHDGTILCDQSYLRQPGELGPCSGPTSPEKCAQCHLQGNRKSVEARETPESLPQLFSLRQKITRRILAGFNRVLVPTDYLRNHLEDAGYFMGNVEKKRLGLRPFEVAPKTPSNTLRFGFLGNLVPVKGVEVLLNAFAALPPGSAELHLHGNVPAGPYYHSLAPLLLTPGVHLHGPFAPESLPQILSDVDVGVLPSYSENYPTVLREFLHARIPVVASRTGGIPELIQPGENGFLFSPGDVEQLTLILTTLIERPELRLAAAENIRPVYTMDADAEETAALYHALISSPSPKARPRRPAQGNR